jgi:hypothetical protein
MQENLDTSRLKRVAELVMGQLEVFDEDKLREWNSEIIREIKCRDGQKCYEISKQYRVGDRIEWKGRRGQWVPGIIDRINPKSVSLRANERGQKWKVHYSFLRKAKGGA